MGYYEYLPVVFGWPTVIVGIAGLAAIVACILLGLFLFFAAPSDHY